MEACILLIEDNGDDALLIRRALRKAGADWPLHQVADGDAALDYLEGTGPFADRARYPQPTLVLLDLKLPRRSGLEVLEHLRRHPSLGRTIVVVLTSSRETADVRKAYSLGANSYLVKPINPGAMNALMARLKHYWLDSNEPPVFEAPP